MNTYIWEIESKDLGCTEIIHVWSEGNTLSEARQNLTDTLERQISGEKVDTFLIFEGPFTNIDNVLGKILDYIQVNPAFLIMPGRSTCGVCSALDQ